MKNLGDKAFSLIELLIVISIIGILTGISIFAIQNARITSRDAKRKADLETIRSGFELFRADCGNYPPALPAPGDPLVGSCPASSSEYISSVPGDPIPSREYTYVTTDYLTYQLCAAMEKTSTVGNCGGESCGTDDEGANLACNYEVKNP